MISVSVRKLVKKFDTTIALESVDLSIEPGELFFLLGPSGCGKTTLLRTIAGFYIPDEGQVFFGDKDVTHQEPYKRNAGMVFQSYALWPHMTVAQNVSFGLEQRKLKKEEIKKQVLEALDAVEMQSYAERKPNQLSGGQQQRIALARALVIRPQCLLLDEPLSNLDAKLRLELRMEIRRVCKEHNLTTIYVTHDQKEALSIADRIAILHEGKILQIGSPQDVYKRPQNSFVADFIGETNFITGTILRSEGRQILIKTSLGNIQGVLPHNKTDPVEGSEVTLSVRPESFRIEKNASDNNSFEGTINESVYYGEIGQYNFSSGDINLKIFELNPQFLRELPQMKLYACVDAEDVVVLQD